jgi:hypothetical protein
VIKSREKLCGHVTCVGRIGIGYKIVSGRRESEVSLGEIEEDGKLVLKTHLIDNNFKLWIVLKWIKLGLHTGITSAW